MIYLRRSVDKHNPGHKRMLCRHRDKWLGTQLICRVQTKEKWQTLFIHIFFEFGFYLKKKKQSIHNLSIHFEINHQNWDIHIQKNAFLNKRFKTKIFPCNTYVTHFMKMLGHLKFPNYGFFTLLSNWLSHITIAHINTII